VPPALFSSSCVLEAGENALLRRWRVSLASAAACFWATRCGRYFGELLLPISRGRGRGGGVPQAPLSRRPCVPSSAGDGGRDSGRRVSIASAVAGKISFRLLRCGVNAAALSLYPLTRRRGLCGGTCLEALSAAETPAASLHGGVPPQRLAWRRCLIASGSSAPCEKVGDSAGRCLRALGTLTRRLL